VIEAFLPSTSAKIFDFIGLDSKTFDTSVYEALKEGSEIKKPSLLFAKIEDEQVEKQMEKLKANKKETPAPVVEKEVVVKPNMSFDDFTKLDLKLATIKSADKVKKADRLLHLKIDVAGELKDVVSGIAEHYTPENVIGKTVLYLANLEPRKIRGVLSHGMILMAENKEGDLSFMQPEKAFESGSEVR
jgi:methionyl-tRNA synthetase